MLFKQCRQEAGYTQKELAKILNVSQNAIHQWETGKVEPNIATIEKLCNLYDISMDKFCERKYTNPRNP